ncbi:biogenesis of lysosome-related organelles complex-1 subunit 2-domain-containing protein [Lobosporangium transversale]|uniref:Biogenesis of lysosome-related organelles complex-1 subunit 2-domain-containing protein n=1 Tax=Lobosporangium transversale TaxID=64571 RepID=A0A1Y2G9B8_9FUNG|nr:biogenesis of lysosome-related organelles complex-1 subunit 2-domain-containing protein [Lobosporangium transversale]ORZ04722.1 biogenesis of lysosome-related organelles complex-1 subunit 2-domain-containing protein [Lobosporangium transversale]|eukprot:XP_021876719.1 biogenesis of lysosome-related organelles complex-1 subunit 2-domain-containing protein [Lobosporangium transversale]
MSNSQAMDSRPPSIQLEPAHDTTTATSGSTSNFSISQTVGSTSPSIAGISQLMSPPTKTSATMALSPEQHIPSAPSSPSSPNVKQMSKGGKTISVSPTPSSSSSSLRAPSLHSSVSQQSSTAAQSFSAADAARHLSQEHVTRTSQDMFKKIVDYVKSEMLTTAEDYRLLENMNILTKERYNELAGVAQELMVEVGKLRTTYSDFEPYLARIDEISEQAEMISNIAIELDEYTKSLEMRLKRVTK